ncbi:MAG: tetratricopeptide (TPR) repeat protein [Rhodothermales bacterium]|jgi:tetratricopeptide (TPR) repeat protein
MGKWLGLALGLPLLLSLLVYTPAMKGEFTNWDDTLLVTDNTRIRSLAPSAIIAMLTPIPGRTYQPVRELSYALDYALWEYAPFMYHLENVLLHGLAAGLLALALALLLGRLRPDASELQNRGAALVVALLFAVHPVNVESVAWISSRKYGLLALFTALALLGFANSAKSGRWRLLMMLAVLLACLSSPFAVALVPALLLLEWVGKGGDPLGDAKSAILKNRGLVAIGVGAALFFAWLLVLSEPPGVDSEDVVKSTGGLAATAITMLGVLVEYALNFVWPSGLNNNYDLRLGTGGVLKAGVGLAGVLALGVWGWRRMKAGDRLPALCMGWFVLWWLPVSNLIPISTPMADRYVYLPGIGVFLGFALLFRSRPVAIGAAVAVLLLGVVASQRCRVWQSSETLWRDSLKTRPESFTAHNNLGLALQAKGEYDEAMTEYSEALKARPNHSVALNNMGFCLIESKRPGEAIQVLKASVAKRPNYGDALNNLATALSKTGQRQKALPIIRKAVALEPDRPDRHFNLGNTLLGLDQPQAAIAAFHKALELEPRMAQVYNNLAVANDRLGDRDAAAEAFRNSFRLEPRVSTAMNLALLLALEKRYAEAIAAAEQAKAIATPAEMPMIEQRMAEYRKGL